MILPPPNRTRRPGRIRTRWSDDRYRYYAAESSGISQEGPGTAVCEGSVRNPGGRARGSTNRATRAAELLLDGEATALTRKAVELAFAGDAAALRLCLDRTVAPRRERSVELALPPIHSAADILGAIKVVGGAVGRGTITPGEAVALSQMIETFLRAIDASDFENRLRRLEERQAAGRQDVVPHPWATV
jgi:hypothetical protein